MAEGLGDFFKLIAEDKKRKKEEFKELVGEIDIDSIFSQVKESIVEDKENAEKVQKQAAAFESWLFSETEEKKEEIVAEVAEVFRDEVETIEPEPEEEVVEEVEEETTISKSIKILDKLKEEEDPLNDTQFATFDDLKKHYQTFLDRISVQLSSLGGGGEAKFRYLDDIVGVATNLSAYDGMYLGINTSNSAKPFVFSAVAGGSGITTAEVRDAIQGYYGYETDYYTVGVANTTQTISAGTTTMIMPQVASVFQELPTIMTGVGTNPYVGTAATIGTGQTEFSFAGLSSGASCIVRTALAFNPDEDNTNLDVQLKFTTNTATQAAGTTNYTILKEQALIMNEGGDQQYISESVFSFFIGSKLEGTTYDNSGSFRVEVIPTSDGELEVLAVTVNVVA